MDECNVRSLNQGRKIDNEILYNNITGSMLSTEKELQKCRVDKLSTHMYDLIPVCSIFVDRLVLLLNHII